MSGLTPECVAEIVALVGTFVGGLVIGLLGRLRRKK